MRSRLLAVALVVLLAPLTSCGEGTKDGPSTKAAEVMSKADLDKALLTVKNLGPQFVREKEGDEGEGDDSIPGCLNALTGEIGPDDEAGTDRTFELEGEGLPSVSTAISAFESEARAQESLDGFVKALEDCDEVTETDKDGLRTALDVDLIDDKLHRRADRWVTLEAAGTIGKGEIELLFGLSCQVVRIDNYVLVVLFGNMAKLGTESTDVLNAAIDRFNAVKDGTPLPQPVPVLKGSRAPRLGG